MQGRIRHTRAAAQSGRRCLISRRLVLPFIAERFVFLGHSHQQVFQRQFQLRDPTLDLLRGFAKCQFLQLGDPKGSRQRRAIA